MTAKFVSRIQMTDDVAEFWVEPFKIGDRQVLTLGMQSNDGDRVEMFLELGDAVILAEHIRRLATPARTTVFNSDPEF